MSERSQSYAQRVRQFVDEVALYPVSCEPLANGRSDEEWLEAVLAGGARIVQLRDKHSSDQRLLAKARYFRERTRRAGALFLVHDRVDIALLAEADGVHVGQQDLPPAEVRKLAPEMIIGVSCNSLQQAAQLGAQVRAGSAAATYFNIGPLFATTTKAALSDFIGPAAITTFSAACALPFTVMGGIKLAHVAEVVALGARRIALVTALSRAEDIAAETAKWIAAIKEARGKHHG